MVYEFIPSRICSRKITFEITDGKLYNVRFEGGCLGNLKAIGRLVEGESAAVIANILRGNQCGNKGTSCADQLAIAIDEALSKERAKAS